MRALAVCFGLLMGCTGGDPKTESDEEEVIVGLVDGDGDGFLSDEDCNDNQADIHPSATEICDGIDNNCDDQVDEGVLTTSYADVDGDGYGDPDNIEESCEVPDGYVPIGNDCDDGDAGNYPGASEQCDSVDNDCDGEIDEGIGDQWYLDDDGDGHGTEEEVVWGCSEPDGYVASWDDCDDSNDAIYPGADESCNGVDDDCNGVIDDGGSLDSPLWYLDYDGDGYGDPESPTGSCEQPSGYVADDTDCEPLDAAQYPGADELCNGSDDDCDGSIDESDAVDVSTWYLDYDGDGYGDPAYAEIACDGSSGYVSDSTDCDPLDSEHYPGADEVCDGDDDDCDGTVDEDDAVDVGTWYADSDSDGYGDPAASVIDCDAPSGYVSDSTDCDPSNADQHPGAEELCNDEDDDCDGAVDEDEAGDVRTWYEDSDGDGYGDPSSTDVDCNQPSGYVSDDTDCEPADGAQYPGADELCNGSDDDCDGSVDEESAVDATSWYADADGDGYGDVYTSRDACESPTGHVEDDTDCDDTDSAVYPTASETCDYVDEDCDGSTDEVFRTGSAYTAFEHCGFCDNDCGTYVFDHGTTYCDPSLSTPECTFSCDTGFYDANGDPDDGCECAQLSTTDEPFDGIDQDCDGLDGDHSDAVHVSVDTGSPLGDGSDTDPLESIQDGIDLAVAEGKIYLLVAEGHYDEDIELVEGLVLYGGYDLVFSERDVVTYDSTIVGTGSASATVTAIDITAETVLDGFTIQGNASTRDGSSAIGLWLEDCDDSLEIRHCTISADDAFDGGDSDNGDDGNDGQDGSSGSDARMGTCGSLPSGGSGGAMACPDGDTPDGGDGADASCPSAGAFQDDGARGDGIGGGTGGDGACDAEIGRWDCGSCSIDSSCWGTGGNGDFGSDGDHGLGGSGAADAGASASGRWIPEDGSEGDPGDAGSGGGGGGAGSGVEVDNTCSNEHLSATGGGGGSGGCGGRGGEGGQGGGSSFGVLFTCSASCANLPIIEDSELSSADAGDGGDGGHGGTGGAAGYGGIGGASSSIAWCALDGGAGGDGGEGGNGGGGGGGAGGHSYAVYAEGVTPSATWISASNTMGFGYAGRGGSGGAGGDSSTHGVDGAAGEEGKQNW